MDQRLIQEKLEALRRCVRRVEDKRPPSVERLLDNPDLQDIITLNLTRAVQLRGFARAISADLDRGRDG